MVGVPGRSQACAACRKRKISCDGQKPVCGQCVRSKKSCDFDKKLVFVINDEGSHKTVYKKPNPNLRKRDAEHGSESEISLPPTSMTLSKRPAPTSNDSSFYPWLLPRSPVHRPLVLQQLLSFAVSHPSTANPLPRPWTSALAFFSASTDPIPSSPLACTLASISHYTSDPTLLTISRTLYQAGLVESRRLVASPKTALSDLALASVLALITYELLECPGGSLTAYHWHRNGCSKLVRLRGAAAHQTGLAHELFLEYRRHGLLHDLEAHRPSFLMREEWRSVPFAVKGRGRYDRFIDLFGRAPEVLAKADEFGPLLKAVLEGGGEAAMVAMTNKLREMWMDCCEVDRELESFIRGVEQDYGAVAMYWESESSAVEGEGEDPMVCGIQSLGSPFVFLNLEVAHILTISWAYQAMVWNGQTALMDTALQFGDVAMLGPPAPDTESFNKDRMDWLSAIRKVCRSVNYCTQSALFRGTGPMVIAGPLNIIIDIMKGKEGVCDTELKVALDARDDIGKKWLRILSCSEEPSSTTQ